MSGISSSTGLVSGLDTASIINQLLSIESRPKALIQTRVVELKGQQAAFLDINSKLSALKSAAQNLRINKLFKAAKVASTNADALTGTATAGAPNGNYTFLVDRLVSTQQQLSRGFTDRNTTAIGLTSLSFEPPQALLTTDTELSQLNGANGISRGKIVVTNRAGTATTVDLSRVSKMSEVLSAFNDNADLKVTASVKGGQLILTDTSGGTGSFSVRSAAGYTTAESLGIVASTGTNTIAGSNIYKIGDNTSLQSLNDGNGIRIRRGVGSGDYDFTLKTKDGSSYNVDIGEIWADAIPPATTATLSKPAVSTFGQLKQRILEQTANKVTLEVNPEGTGFRIVDNTGGGGNLEITDTFGAATDLGLTTAIGAGGTATTSGNTLDTKTLLSGINSTLASGINGGRGLTSNALSITARNGSTFNFTVNTTGSINDLLQSISDETGGAITATLDSRGQSIILTDTVGGVGNLIVSGGAATELGVATVPAGVAAATVTGTRVNRGYITQSTLVGGLNNGKGIGTGSFTIRGPGGVSKVVNIRAEDRTIEDVLKQINGGTNINVIARINDAGNGIILEKDPTFTGADQKISVTDDVGAVGKALNLAGEASDFGTSNFIDGSFRRSVSILATDTLDQVITKINTAKVGVTAAVVTDGGSSNPFRLRLTSSTAGEAGRYLVDSAGADLALDTISQGVNTRAFYGSDDPARAILISRNTTTIDGVIDNLRVDAKSASNTPVTLTVSSDVDSTVTAIQDFVKAFNALSTKLGEITTYNATTETRGTLLGDSAALSLRTELYSTLQSSGLGVAGQYRVLAQVGMKIAKDNTISIDESRLRTALEADPDAVAEVFSAFSAADPQTTQNVLDSNGNIVGTVNVPNPAARYTQLGVLEKVGILADKYVNTVNGVLTARNKSIDSQITLLNNRVTDFDRRIASKRNTLERQFANLESTLATLQRQQSSLSGISNLVNSKK